MSAQTRRLGIISMSLIAIVALSGCVGSAGEKLSDIPKELTVGTDAEEGMTPTVVWADDGEHWLVLTYGSSTCATEPREVTKTADNAYEIRLEESGGLFCTTDLGPTAYRISAPVSRGTKVTIDLGPGISVTI